MESPKRQNVTYRDPLHSEPGTKCGCVRYLTIPMFTSSIHAACSQSLCKRGVKGVPLTAVAYHRSNHTPIKRTNSDRAQNKLLPRGAGMSVSRRDSVHWALHRLGARGGGGSLSTQRYENMVPLYCPWCVCGQSGAATRALALYTQSNAVEHSNKLL